MGLSDSTVTLEVYSHFIPDTQDKALNALDNLIIKNDGKFIRSFCHLYRYKKKLE